ncbi:hypothetical protein GFS24_18715 [Chitinophaga sp. SYP-B3965]|uniref:hypothetical protein n=1 Tax=Chitinophaga sp. SYP-B3965 TaxID=2663120 RepID=UPI001299DE0D|nr:hypothetical protein [Chitinophaga sp. SYP-B3965]MRG47161.1 hypothetical protein [Chitinophaga sp. SYP-B3965]
MQTALIVVIVLAAIALIAFLIKRNKRDRKELFPPGSTDPVEEEKKEQEGNEDRL